MRTINYDPIIEWVNQRGPYGTGELAFKAKISPSMVAKIMARHYMSMPKEWTMKRICKVIGKDMDEVFPLSHGDAS